MSCALTLSGRLVRSSMRPSRMSSGSASSSSMVRDPTLTAWNGERESRAGGAAVRLRPDTTAMVLDDRAADEQSDAHAAALRRVEGGEQGLKILPRKSHACISHGQAHLV